MKTIRAYGAYMMFVASIFAGCGGDNEPGVEAKTGTLVKARFVAKQVANAASSLVLSDAHAQAAEGDELTAFLMEVGNDRALFITSPGEKIFRVLLNDGTIPVETAGYYASTDCTGPVYVFDFPAMVVNQRVFKLGDGKYYLVSKYLGSAVTIKSQRLTKGDCEPVDLTFEESTAEVVEYTETIPDFTKLAPIQIGLQGL